MNTFFKQLNKIFVEKFEKDDIDNIKKCLPEEIMKDFSTVMEK